MNLGPANAYPVVSAAPYWASLSPGIVAVASAGVNVTLEFPDQPRYPVRFAESALPTGAKWRVDVGTEREPAGRRSWAGQCESADLLIEPTRGPREMRREKGWNTPPHARDAVPSRFGDLSGVFRGGCGEVSRSGVFQPRTGRS